MDELLRQPPPIPGLTNEQNATLISRVAEGFTVRVYRHARSGRILQETQIGFCSVGPGGIETMVGIASDRDAYVRGYRLLRDYSNRP